MSTNLYNNEPKHYDHLLNSVLGHIGQQYSSDSTWNELDKFLVGVRRYQVPDGLGTCHPFGLWVRSWRSKCVPSSSDQANLVDRHHNEFTTMLLKPL